MKLRNSAYASSLKTSRMECQIHTSFIFIFMLYLSFDIVGSFPITHVTKTQWSSRSQKLVSRINFSKPKVEISSNRGKSTRPSFVSSWLAGADSILINFLQPKTEGDITRRLFFASALFAGGGALSFVDKRHSAALASGPMAIETFGNLQWATSPVNKRSGVTVFDAERLGYNVKFVTYLTRFLLGFDADCQKWWYLRASDLPRRASAEEVNDLRFKQFGAFSASVEVGLQEYRGPDGPVKLMNALLKRYCPDTDVLDKERESQGLAPLSDSAKAQQLREIKEARRQIALLFGLMEYNQPVEEISKLLAAIDNGYIANVEILDPGSGYAPGYGAPAVEFPPPDAGSDYERATGRAVLTPNGKILRIDLVNRGFGYNKVPTVTISPPSISNNSSDTAAATAKAVLFRQGANKGRLERIQLTEPGAGYTKDDVIRVRISPPEMSASEGGLTATATAVLEYEVSSIGIIKNGTGYAVEKPINIYVEPPPLTARVNMNDPMMARIISPNEPLPKTTIPSKEMIKKMKSFNSDPSSLSAQIEKFAVNDGKGGGGGCIGRACYDRPVVAVAYPKAEMDSYNMFRNTDEANRISNIEAALENRSAETFNSKIKRPKRPRKPTVSGTTTGPDSSLPTIPSFGGGPSPSAQLLSLLPDGIGLVYDKSMQRYRLASGPDFPDWTQALASTKPLDPEYGPRGRSPIERDMRLGLSSYLRFSASGAICCSAVHLAVTPVDVVKTKIQTNPLKYKGILSSFQMVLKEEGWNAYFTGWQPTFVGFFVYGGLSYVMTEFIRRYLTELAGSTASEYEVPIILIGAGVAAIGGSVILSPFESVRIRSVAQPNFANSTVGVVKRMLNEEGLGSLFSAVPAFWLKEIPFAMAKFTVFDISTAWMYENFPAATEDLQLSLLVSLIGGTLGGFAAAIVSNPADATIAEMKKAKSSMGPLDAANKLIARDGPSGLLKGLRLRMVFYPLVVSLQFLVYDAVRIALGIGSDDLKLYLDVLGGALQEKGGPL
jgi:solute carrier family 25 (mitochondrial phosphate transporter), member 3